MRDRDGSKESLHSFIRREVAPEADDQFANREGLSSVLKHPHQRDSVLLVLVSLLLIYLGGMSQEALWYKVKPSIIEGQGHRHRFPRTPIWIGPQIVYADAEVGTLDGWVAQACDVDALRVWAQQHRRSPLFAAKMKEHGCQDENEVSCRQMQRQDLCTSQADARSRCQWRCDTCARDEDQWAKQEKEVVQEWCMYRIKVAKNVKFYFWGIVLCSLVLLATLPLLCWNPVAGVVLLAQGGGNVCLFFLLFSIGTTNAGGDYDKTFVNYLNQNVTDPLFGALHELTATSLDRGQMHVSSVTLLVVGWAIHLLAVGNLVAWLGQIHQRQLSAPLAVFYRLCAGALWVMFICPPYSCWKLWDGRGSCNTTFDPEFYMQSVGWKYKNAWGSSKHRVCCGKRVPKRIGRIFNDLKGLLTHMKRVGEWDGFLYAAPVFSEAEKITLEERGIMDPGVQNYLAWRRSVIVMVVFMGVLQLPIMPMTVYTSLQMLRDSAADVHTADTFEMFALESTFDLQEEEEVEFVEPSEEVEGRCFGRPQEMMPPPATAQETHLLSHVWSDKGLVHATSAVVRRLAEEDPSPQGKDYKLFAQYWIAMTKKSLALWQRGLLEVQLYENIIHWVADWTAIFSIILAHSTWQYLPLSRSWVILSWVLHLFNPFVISFVPVSTFISPTEGSSLMKTVLAETVLFLNMSSEVNSCEDNLHRRLEIVGNTTQRIDAACMYVQKFHFLHIFANAQYALLREACREWNEKKNILNVPDLLDKMGLACKSLQVSLGVGRDPALEVKNVLDEQRKEFTQVLTALITLKFTLQKVFKLLPCVLALCPAVVIASLRMRLFLPLSILPTMFVKALPLISSPMMWVLYCTVWQIVPSFGLQWLVFSLCWAQTLNSIMTVHCRLEEPVSRAYLNRSLKKIFALGKFRQFIELSCIVFGLGALVWHTPCWLQQIIIKSLLNTLRRSSLIMGFLKVVQIVGLFLLVFLFKFWLSKVAAYDFVLSQVTAEHEFEVCVKGMRAARAALSDDDRKVPRMDAVLALHKESKETLDVLVDMKMSTNVISDHQRL